MSTFSHRLGQLQPFATDSNRPVSVIQNWLIGKSQTFGPVYEIRGDSELRERVMACREELKHLVLPPSSNRTTHAYQFTTAHLTGHQGGSSPSASRVDDFVEVVTWRRLTSGTSVRYVCLEAFTTKQYAVVTADLFSEPVDSLFEGLSAKVNHRVASVIRSGEFEWFDTASEAMDDFDKSI